MWKDAYHMEQLSNILVLSNNHGKKIRIVILIIKSVFSLSGKTLIKRSELVVLYFFIYLWLCIHECSLQSSILDLLSCIFPGDRGLQCMGVFDSLSRFIEHSRALLITSCSNYELRNETCYRKWYFLFISVTLFSW